MSVFEKFVNDLAEDFKSLQKDDVILVQVKPEENKIWDLYINQFKNDKIFLTQKEHDCRTCKNSLQQMYIVGINKNYEIITLFSNYENYPEPYKSISKKLDEYLKSLPIYSLFYYSNDIIGIPKNFGEKEINGEKKIFEFHHFYFPIINSQYIVNDVNQYQQKSIENYNLIKSSLEKISLFAIETVLDLINTNSIYRGEEFKYIVEKFKEIKKNYDKLSEKQKNLYLWTILNKYPEAIFKIKNTVIGTLLIDITDEVDIEKAITSYEKKVAPTNYKRSTAIVTPQMIENLKKELEKEGLLDSLHRRTATDKDIELRNIIWKNSLIKKNDDIFSKILDEINIVKNLDENKLQNISLDKFIKDILPNIRSLEILGNNERKMILTTAINKDSKILFKWNNHFSWYYTGDVADSYIAKRVKEMGGEINVDLRFSLHWWDASDYDIHCYEKNQFGLRNLIYYGKKENEMIEGYLDVDMNVSPSGDNFSMDAVENIIFKDKNKLPDNKVFIIGVENYTYRNKMNKPGFEMEIKIGNKKYLIKYDKKLKQDERIIVCKFKKIGNEINIEFDKNIKLISKFNNGKFYPVSLITYSPNCWDGNCIGNKHIFFFSPRLKWGDEKIRGFFNEQLKEDLYRKHRKALELVGAKIEITPDKNSLVGFGYSITQKDSIIVKYITKTNIQKIVKVNL